MLIADRNGFLVDWESPDYWGLCFTAEQANSTISMSGSASNISLLYSFDTLTWLPFVPDETTITLPLIGSKVWLKAGDGGN